MKATGIVRRIDDLGRVVIPKEIRRTLRIREGDPLEIYTEKDGEVIFKKYSPMGDLTEFAAQICESMGKNTGHIAAVCDRDAIIAVYGAQRRELIDNHCSQELERLMESRKIYRYQPGQARLHPSDASERYFLGVAAPILAEGDLMGAVMLLLDEQDAPLTEAEQFQREGVDFLNYLKACCGRLGSDADEELVQMRKICASILGFVHNHPEQLGRVRRFREYYLPTTRKLLDTAQGLGDTDTANAAEIRRDITGILHTLNQAYAKLYDTLLQDVSMDVSTEIDTLETMLRQDGLTHDFESDFNTRS